MLYHKNNQKSIEIIELSDINIVVKNANMPIEIKIKKHVYVSYQGIKEELTQVVKDVKLVDVVDAQKKTLSFEEKIRNIIQKIEKNKTKKSNSKDLKRGMDAVKVV